MWTRLKIWRLPLALFSTALMWVMAVAWPIIFLMFRLIIPLAVILALTLLYFEWSWPYRWTAWLVGIPISVFYLLLARQVTAPAVRYSLRLSPLRLGNASRTWVPWILVVTWLAVVGIFWIFIKVEPFVLALVILVGLLGLWKSWQFRRTWTGYPSSDHILFLRRFGKSADRTVTTAVRQTVPEGVSLIFLASKGAEGASLDPFLVGFDGLNLGWDPESIPLYVQARDDEWEIQVRKLVQSAKAVIFDATDWSEAMAVEASIIEEMSAVDKTIVLVRKRKGVGEAQVRGRQMIWYRRSWKGTFDRMFWGCFLVVALPQVMLQAERIADPNLIVTVIATVVLGSAAIWMFVRPLMDAESVTALRDTLSEICSQK